MTSRLLAKTLFRMASRPGATAADIADRFLRFAAENHWEYSVPGVLVHLKREHARRSRESLLRIVSAHPLKKARIDDIREYVGAPGDVGTEALGDAALVGGFIADFRGKTYDASIKTQLRLLQKHLLDTSFDAL